MSALPIRVRLTLVFTCSMAVVLVATGAFLYLRVGGSLDHNIREGLDARYAEISELAREGSPLRGAVIPDDRDEQFAQLLTARGAVVDETSQTVGTSLLRPDELRRALRGGMVWDDRTHVSGIEDPVRLLAGRVASRDGPLVLVVGVSLGERDQAVRRLLAELLVVGPAALLIASLLGYWLGSAALRPVESMRAEAAAISAAALGRRLTLPRARDEIRRLGETLNATLDRLEGALERERAFVADAGHEIRSPVSRLNAELELAQRPRRSRAELADAIRSAADEARLLARLSEDLLLLARSDEGRLPLHRAPVDVAAALEAVCARFRDEAARDGRRIDVAAPEGLAVDADRDQLQQALRNGVANALRHGSGTVSVVAIEGPDRVELHVLDEGPGVPPEFLPRAFARFSQADRAHASDGTGLGLAIIDAIAAAHGGSARLANRPGGGADLLITLPRTSVSGR